LTSSSSPWRMAPDCTPADPTLSSSNANSERHRAAVCMHVYLGEKER
jgi:hypothetical protein